MSNDTIKTGLRVSFAFITLFVATRLTAECELRADKVLVKKSERKLYLLSDGKVIREYPISLGGNPMGHKQQRGDKRTPEGKYVLRRRNPDTEYYKSILFSYPNEQDRRNAESRGVDPGGGLAIHGLPVSSEEEAWDYIERDWTDGCIAVTNEHMEEIWHMVDTGIPIEILP